jgi:hypothetical protein
MTVGHDNRLDDAPMLPVMCGRCGAEVQVRKSSWPQTSVQWTCGALARCEERCTAMQLADHGERGLFLTCSALRGSIDEAADNGSLPVVDDVPESSVY